MKKMLLFLPRLVTFRCWVGCGVRIAQDRVSVNPGPVLSAQNLDTAGGGFNLRDETLNMVFNTRALRGLGVSEPMALTPF
jgi:hypothetical protein